MPRDKIAIAGVGALACWYGARLSEYHDVTLIGRWPEQIAALQRDGLRIRIPDGEMPDREEHIPALKATDDPASIEPVDWALILTKSPKTAQAASDIAPILKPDGLAVTLQNGLGNFETLAAAVGMARAAVGVSLWGVTVIEPGVIRVVTPTAMTTIATRPEIEQQVRRFKSVMDAALLLTDIVPDLAGLQWRKLAINAAINPLTALLRVRNGQLLDSPAAREIMDAAAHEVAAVAAAAGIALDGLNAGQVAAQVAQDTAQNRSSMLQDVTRGAPTEIDAICGAVVRAGEKVGVTTPVNRLLYQMIKAVEDTYADSTHD